MTALQLSMVLGFDTAGSGVQQISAPADRELDDQAVVDDATVAKSKAKSPPLKRPSGAAADRPPPAPPAGENVGGRLAWPPRDESGLTTAASPCDTC